MIIVPLNLHALWDPKSILQGSSKELSFGQKGATPLTEYFPVMKKAICLGGSRESKLYKLPGVLTCFTPSVSPHYTPA